MGAMPVTVTDQEVRNTDSVSAYELVGSTKVGRWNWMIIWAKRSLVLSLLTVPSSVTHLGNGNTRIVVAHELISTAFLQIDFGRGDVAKFGFILSVPAVPFSVTYKVHSDARSI